jgi:hypothetical protein
LQQKVLDNIELLLYNFCIMAEGGHSPEQASEPEYKQEWLQYNDDQLALLITGEQGAKFDWNMHKYSPTEIGNEGILKTKSGNNYYIFTDRDKTYLVNARETHEQKKIIAASGEYPLELPPLEFGKPWNASGFYHTSDIESLLLRYKIAAKDTTQGRKIDSPNPFDKYAEMKGALSKRAR